MASPAIIAVDIDGTLLSPAGDVLPGTRAEFARARAAGATIVLASGRPIAGLRHLIARLKLETDGLVLAGANGAVTVDATSGAVLGRHPLEHDLLHRTITFAAQHDVLVMISDGGDLVVDRPDHPQIEIEAVGNDLTVRPVPDLRNLTVEDVTADKFLMYAPGAVLRPVAEAFTAEFGDLVESAFSAPFYFEATAAGVHKGAALEDVAAARGLDVLSSVAFGDNHNDLPLLRRAGLGVAMGNAVATVRDQADRVTAANDAEGIAAVLMELYGDGTPAPAVPIPEGVEPLHALDLTEDEPDDPSAGTRGEAV